MIALFCFRVKIRSCQMVYHVLLLMADCFRRRRQVDRREAGRVVRFIAA
jgi:hypothetical protein